MIRAGLLLPALLATPATTAKPMVTICSRKGALKIVASGRTVRLTLIWLRSWS
jgi:hypothetical protein